MPLDLTHWRDKHPSMVTFMVTAAAIGLVVCIAFLIYLHFRDRKIREIRRAQNRERDRTRSKKPRKRRS
ncbi:hypothetical protein [Roseateles sp. PN1]|uniref:hypothetical protein n=1 Tax=Roseateles sp. PN1 TaxID=3137372 RepID=UPI003138C29B